MKKEITPDQKPEASNLFISELEEVSGGGSRPPRCDRGPRPSPIFTTLALGEEGRR